MKKGRSFKSRLVVFLCLVIFGFSACQKSQVIYDLSQEQQFAQKKGEVFIHDYMRGRDDEWLGKGWSKLKKQGTRLAAFPSSKLRFFVQEIEPLHLFFVCKPFLRDGLGAENIRIELNEKELIRVKLKKGIDRFLNIDLPADEIRRNENWLEFFYGAGKENNRDEPVSSEEKRKFSIIFYDLMISSHPEFKFARKYILIRQKVAAGVKTESFIQKVPSSIDFYLDIPEQSFFDARYTFYPSSSRPQAGIGPNIEISIQKPGESERAIHSISLSGEKSSQKLKVELSATEGTVRFHLKAGDLRNADALKGFLVWERFRLIGKAKKKEKEGVSPPALSGFREFLSDKNIIIIIFDAARADHFSTYGYFRPTTPNTDRFAQSSTVFTNAFSEAISTRCSIATLFTGFPLTVTSVTKITSGLPGELLTLSQLFRSSGFKTAGYTGVGNIGSVFRFNRGFDQFYELYKEEGFFRKSQQYLPYVLPWLEANKDKQFFLYVHFKEPHAVYKPLPPFLGMFSGSFEEKIDLTKYQEMRQDLSEQQVEYIKACYDENLASADSAFGKILDKMDDLDLSEKTIVILMADHGELLGESGRQFGHGGYFGEGVMHIPLLMRFPSHEGLEFSGKIDALVKMSDVFATLADVYRFDIPWSLIGGRSLLPVLAGSRKEVNSFVVVERRERTGFCIRSKRYKLILWDNDPVEFYDLEKDPHAENNIYQRGDIVANRMLEILKRWIATQEVIRSAVLEKNPSEMEIGYDQIDKETLENLKALGYIK